MLVKLTYTYSKFSKVKNLHNSHKGCRMSALNFVAQTQC